MLNVRKFTLNREQATEAVLITTDERLDGLIELPITLQVSLSGEIRDKKPFIAGEVSGDLASNCQVCTESIVWHHEFDFSLYPVEQTELDSLEETMDPILIEDGKLDLQDMLVNELILSLPSVVTHLATRGEDCSKQIRLSVGEKVPEKASPFAVLEQLKSSTKGD